MPRRSALNWESLSRRLRLRWPTTCQPSRLGQLPFVDGELTAVGKVGDTVSAEQATEAARTAVLNAIAAAADVAGGLDAIKRVVRVVVFVNSAPDFTGQAGVANGASQLLGQIFGEHGRHARSAVGVVTLPLGSAVEVELTVEV